MKTWIYILILVISSLTSCDYIDDLRFRSAIEQGNQFHDSGKYHLAITEFIDAKNH